MAAVQKIFGFMVSGFSDNTNGAREQTNCKEPWVRAIESLSEHFCNPSFA